MTHDQPPGQDVIAWRGPWTRAALAITGLIVAAAVTAVAAEHAGDTVLRSVAIVAALTLGLALLAVIGRADREGAR